MPYVCFSGYGEAALGGAVSKWAGNGGDWWQAVSKCWRRRWVKPPSPKDAQQGLNHRQADGLQFPEPSISLRVRPLADHVCSLPARLVAYLWQSSFWVAVPGGVMPIAAKQALAQAKRRVNDLLGPHLQGEDAIVSAPFKGYRMKPHLDFPERSS